jgi:hypothetical protein
VACFELRRDLLRLELPLDSDDLDFDIIKPLVIAALADSLGDPLIWNQNYHAVVAKIELDQKHHGFDDLEPKGDRSAGSPGVPDQLQEKEAADAGEVSGRPTAIFVGLRKAVGGQLEGLWIGRYIL